MKTFGKDPGRKLFCRTGTLPAPGPLNFILNKGPDPDSDNHCHVFIGVNFRHVCQNDPFCISIIHIKKLNFRLVNFSIVRYPGYDLQAVLHHAPGI